jgi:hypothetical protein
MDDKRLLCCRPEYGGHVAHGRQVVRRFTAVGLGIPRDLAVGVAALGLAGDSAIAASTLLPSAPVVGQWPQFVLFVLALGVNVRTAALAAGRDLADGVSPTRRAIYIVGFVTAWAVAVLSILASKGVPEMHHGAYFLDNHSNLTQVSRATYEHAQVLQQRIFTLIGATFFAATLIAHAPRPWGPGLPDPGLA